MDGLQKATANPAVAFCIWSGNGKKTCLYVNEKDLSSGKRTRGYYAAVKAPYSKTITENMKFILAQLSEKIAAFTLGRELRNYNEVVAKNTQP